MKSARDRAIDIVQELLGVGKNITKQIDVVERGLIRDRADCDNARSPVVTPAGRRAVR